MSKPIGEPLGSTLRELSRFVTLGLAVPAHIAGMSAMSCQPHGTPHVRSRLVEHDSWHTLPLRKYGTGPDVVHASFSYSRFSHVHASPEMQPVSERKYASSSSYPQPYSRK